MELHDEAGLGPDALAELGAVVDGHSTLAEVVRWGMAHRPPRVVLEVVTQDEYTQDVLIAYRDGLYLAYDST